MDVCKEKSPSMAEPLIVDFAGLRPPGEMSAPDLDTGAGEKDGAGFLSFMKGLLGNVVKLSSPTSPKSATPSEPNQGSKEETRESLPSRVVETECKKATKEKQNERLEQKETENEKVDKKETEIEKVEQKETEKPAQEKGKEATAQSDGQKECKFYSMPGGCKYGRSCRFAHHLGKSDVGSVELNFLGLPIRPGKRECLFYMRTGNCKFSTNCWFHHPDPTADSALDATYEYSNGEAQNQNSSGASQMPTTPWPEPRTMNEPIPFQDASPSYMPGLILPQCDDSGEKTLDLSTVKGEKKNLCKKDEHARIEKMKVTLGLSDSQRTPTAGETLGYFYRRTRMYWQMTARKHTQHTGNELGKAAFDLAKARYKEVKPLLDELSIPEADGKAEEKTGAETSSRNKVNPVGRKAGAEKWARKKASLLETSSRRKAAAKTSSRKEVNYAKTSSQKEKEPSAENPCRKEVNSAETKFQKIG